MNIDCIEAIRLLDESGFGFLPESDLQNQPILETVMSVGLRQCALEFSAKHAAEHLVLPHYVWAPAGDLSS